MYSQDQGKQDNRRACGPGCCARCERGVGRSGSCRWIRPGRVDIAVTQILQGPIGFVAGVAAMVVGAVSAIQQRIMEAIPAILGGAVLMNAETLVTSLGVVV